MEKWRDEAKKTGNDLQPKKRFSTISNLDVEPVYSPESIRDMDFDNIGYPGEIPT